MVRTITKATKAKAVEVPQYPYRVQYRSKLSPGMWEDYIYQANLEAARQTIAQLKRSESKGSARVYRVVKVILEVM